MYLYQGKVDTLYRIHGTTQPWSIGKSLSSGCIRLINQDIIDLYSRVPIGTQASPSSATPSPIRMRVFNSHGGAVPGSAAPGADLELQQWRRVCADAAVRAACRAEPDLLVGIDERAPSRGPFLFVQPFGRSAQSAPRLEMRRMSGKDLFGHIFPPN